MKMVLSYPGCHKVRSTPAEIFQSLDKGRMLWYNILGDNEGRISHILRLGPISAGFFLLTVNLVALKRENPNLILTAKRT